MRKTAFILLVLSLICLSASSVIWASKLDSKTLAVVNGYKITKAYFEQKYQELQANYQSAFKNNKEGFLEQLIGRELLYQEATKKGIAKKITAGDSEKKKDEAIREFIRSVSNTVVVTDDEIREFYVSHPTEVNGASYDDIKESIHQYLLNQKSNDAINGLIIQLRKKATITKNERWLAEQAALKPKNPLTKALKNGKPTVLDLGSSTCVPCKMMKPIFAELEKTYKGKANILLLEINDYRDLSAQYQVRVIPTQIFFDKNGKQVWRHEGFLSKEEIIKKLKELGVE